MSNEVIEVRQARADDVEQIWPLVQDFATSFRPERSSFDLAFSKVVDRADTVVLVAPADRGVIVGYLLGSYHATFFANGPVAWIEELMVAKTVRRRGVCICAYLLGGGVGEEHSMCLRRPGQSQGQRVLSPEWLRGVGDVPQEGANDSRGVNCYPQVGLPPGDRRQGPCAMAGPSRQTRKADRRISLRITI